MTSQYYKVNEVAQLAGVCVRTLHHYHQIKLLLPHHLSDAGYRNYSRVELFRLQQILFYREIGLTLNEIKQLLDNPDFSAEDALISHKKRILKEVKRLTQLEKTIDKTLLQMKNKNNMTEEEIYAGFTNEEAQNYRKEAMDKWGKEKVVKSEEKLKKMHRADFAALKKEGEDISEALAKGMNLPVDHPEIQALIDQHYKMTCQYWDCPIDAYAGLGKMYVNDARFTAFYEKYADGLAKYLNEAIDYYCSKH